MKKTMAMVLAFGMVFTALTGCGSADTKNETTAAALSAETTKAGSADTTAQQKDSSGFNGAITVVSREDGSGTRGAFIELFGVQEKVDDKKVDMTTEDAEISNSTSVVMTTVAGNKEAIGYISLGSLNDTVKALKIDGAEATVDHIKSGTYKISRPFNIVTKEGISEAAQDFIKFIMSEAGQAEIEKDGYISKGNEGAYKASGLSGKIVVAGSSSVSPVMEKLKEAYIILNPDVTVEIQQSDSTTGVTSTIEGVCDIGMASRELKDSETEKGAVPTVIAMDGIAMIANKENPINELTGEQVKAIYVGEMTDWSEIQ